MITVTLSLSSINSRKWWVHENIIIIRHLWETNQRPRHAKSETNMSDRRPIKDLHAPVVTDIPHWRPTYLIGDPSETSKCFIGDPSETDMPHRRPIWNQHAPWETHWIPTCLSVSDEACWGLRWVSDQAWLSPVVLWSGKLVSNGSSMKQVGLWWSMPGCPMGLRSGIWRSLLKHVEVSDQACRSPMGLR